MAFGTWLKGLIGNIGTAIKKALPIAKKVVDAVAPAAQKIGGMIGGKVGGGIQKFADTAQSFVNGSSSLGTSSLRTNMVGANGAGIRRLTPILK